MNEVMCGYLEIHPNSQGLEGLDLGGVQCERPNQDAETALDTFSSAIERFAPTVRPFHVFAFRGGDTLDTDIRFITSNHVTSLALR